MPISDFLEKIYAVSADSNNIINNLIFKDYGRKERRKMVDAGRHQGD
jgi:hypothetical protein